MQSLPRNHVSASCIAPNGQTQPQNAPPANSTPINKPSPSTRLERCVLNVLTTGGNIAPECCQSAERTERVNRSGRTVFHGGVMRNAHVQNERDKTKLNRVANAIGPDHSKAACPCRRLGFEIQIKIVN
jgi:hypothetical protein